MAVGRTRKDAGFTLLEVLIALAIFGVALSSLLTSQLEAMRATAYARGLTAAAYLAEYQLIEIEYQSRKDGWVTSDVEFEGDFSELEWPGIRYQCLVDFIELPEYSQMVAAKDEAEDSSSRENDYQDAGEQAFGMLGMVWPILKGAIENSIRRAECTVYWHDGQVEHEFGVETFWVDVKGLKDLPALGGEATDADDDSGADEKGAPSASGRSGGSPVRKARGQGAGRMAGAGDR